MVVKKNILVTIDDDVYMCFKTVVENCGGSISKYVKNFMLDCVLKNKDFISDVYGDEVVERIKEHRFSKVTKSVY